MTPAYDLLCLSHLRWDFVYQRPQQLLTRCAQSHRVFYVEEPIIAGEQVRLEVSQPAPNIWVAVPYLPASLPSDQYDLPLRQLIDDLIDQHHIDSYVLWYYSPMPIAYTSHLCPLAVVYDCMDELANFDHAPPFIRKREELLFGRADLVFTGGQSLFDAKRARHSSVWCFPSSVDVAHFAHARTAGPDPADQAPIPRPRLGYFGVLDERIDWALLAAIASARPEWQLVLVGPVAKISHQQLPQRANLHYLGIKPYAMLPSYIAGWDVALLPFAHNAATQFISPTKTPEYLAAGKPVVSTAIRDVVRPYGESGLVQIANGVSEFVLGIETALQGATPTWLQRVDAFLAGMSWEDTWNEMDRLLGHVVLAGQAHPLHSSPTAAQGGDEVVLG